MGSREGSNFSQLFKHHKRPYSGDFDKAYSKIGRRLPKCNIPILDTRSMHKYDIDMLIIFPWNLEKEIMADINFMVDCGIEILTLEKGIYAQQMYYSEAISCH